MPNHELSLEDLRRLALSPDNNAILIGSPGGTDSIRLRKRMSDGELREVSAGGPDTGHIEHIVSQITGNPIEFWVIEFHKKQQDRTRRLKDIVIRWP